MPFFPFASQHVALASAQASSQPLRSSPDLLEQRFRQFMHLLWHGDSSSGTV
jgi:hypothetical protein